MTKEENLKQQLHKEGEYLTKVNKLLAEYRGILNNQIIKIQELLGKSPTKNKGMFGHFDTKVSHYAFHLRGYDKYYQYYSKLNYVGTTQDGNTYVKCFVVGSRQYKNLYVKNMKHIDDLAKLIDYFKLIYNVS